MLTSRFIRENMDLVKENLRKRRYSVNLSEFQEMEEQRLQLIQTSEEKKAKRNQVSKEIGNKRGTFTAADLEKIKNEMRMIGEEISSLDDELRSLQDRIDEICFSLPNILEPDVPEGDDEESNIEVRKWGERTTFDFPVKDHVSLLEENNLSDFERAAKVSGSRFAILKKDAARLERALINFFIDENTKAGYTEFHPPTIVNDNSLFGTGQLPKFQEDLFLLSDQNEIDTENNSNDEKGGDISRRQFYLIPTAEVPLTNLHANEIIDENELPLKYTGFTNCYRSEAGSGGRDTRGLIRLHEFGKVEMVNFASPEKSGDALDAMVAQSESLLQKLQLPYRVALLCSGDIGFSAKRCYDIEVWMPGQDSYREISSCSNCGEFQAMRANIRCRVKNEKPRHLHTLNGSGLPIGRTLVAVLENYQMADGKVRVPEVLVPYFGKDVIG